MGYLGRWRRFHGYEALSKSLNNQVFDLLPSSSRYSLLASGFRVVSTVSAKGRRFMSLRFIGLYPFGSIINEGYTGDTRREGIGGRQGETPRHKKARTRRASCLVR